MILSKRGRKWNERAREIVSVCVRNDLFDTRTLGFWQRESTLMRSGDCVCVCV